jgi:hypothetical protein
VAVPASEIIHDRMNCLYHPLVGTSPIFACGTAANMGLQIQENSAAFFGNGSNPSGILTSPADHAEKALELSDLWNARFGKDKSGGVAVLGGGMTFTQMRMSAVDSQTIEQLKWTAETVCSTFHVPPWKVGIGRAARVHEARDREPGLLLRLPPEPDRAVGAVHGRGVRLRHQDRRPVLGVELDLDGLLRMDAASQMETLRKAVGGSAAHGQRSAEEGGSEARRWRRLHLDAAAELLARGARRARSERSVQEAEPAHSPPATRHRSSSRRATADC